MKLLTLFISGIISVNSFATIENISKTELITYSSEARRTLKIHELPLKVQKSVKLVCRGTVIHITKVFLYNNIYYKVICEKEYMQDVYFFDSDGFPPAS